MNGQDVTQCSHQEVVTIISNTPTPGVWLTVCDSNQTAEPRQILHPAINNRLGFSRVQSLGSFSLSQSTPVIPREMMDPRKPYTDDSPPPKYSEVPPFQRNGSASSLSPRGFTSSMQGMSKGISPLGRRVLTQSFQPNGQQHPLMSNGHMSSDQTMFSSVRSSGGGQGQSPTPSAGAYTSASVLVLYIGPVEIPESWSSRELSSRCLQECTRRLLSQRQEFIEAFLEINLQTFKILNVGQTVLFKHKREELYYCGVCTNDEQYFGIVTQKLSSKSGKKSSPNSGRVARAHLCHVFKVIQHKSVLVLSGAPSKGKSSQQIKPKTITVTSCVTIINALQGLFTGETVGTGKLFGSDPSLKSSPSSGGSSESVYGSSPDKTGKRKKLEVVDLRASAFVAPTSQSSILTSSTPPTVSPNIYVSGNIPSMAPGPHSVSTRSQTKADSYPQSLGTPAFHQRSAQGSGTWYSVDSPKENQHGRQPSWEGSRSYTSGEKRNSGGSPSGTPPRKGGSLGSSGRKDGRQGPRFDTVRKMSDDSSLSSLSDSRTPSPTKLSMRSSFTSRSRSPSPTRSPSPHSRSSSPSPIRTWGHQNTVGSMVRHVGLPSNGSKLSAGLALELSSVRARSPTMNMMSLQLRGSRVTLRRQVCVCVCVCVCVPLCLNLVLYCLLGVLIHVSVLFTYMWGIK